MIRDAVMDSRMSHAALFEFAVRSDRDSCVNEMSLVTQTPMQCNMLDFARARVIPAGHCLGNLLPRGQSGFASDGSCVRSAGIADSGGERWPGLARAHARNFLWFPTCAGRDIGVETTCD